MLDIIRNYSQSWAVKITFGVIIIVFVFWGIGNITNVSSSEALSVNGQIITTKDFQNRYSNIEQSIRQNIPNITNAELTNLGIVELVTQQLILETLIAQEAKRLGILVTPLELKQIIETFPEFHNAQGIFDPEIYLQFLEKQHITPGHFESQISTTILNSRLHKELTAGISVDPNEAHTIYNYDKTFRSIDYHIFPLQDYLSQVTISPKEIADTYEDLIEKFKTPAEISLEYLLVNPRTLSSQQHVTEEEISEFYQKNATAYTYPEQIHVQHIVILAPEKSSHKDLEEAKKKITSIETKLKQDKDFSKIARTYSQDAFAKKGGDIGWISKNQVIPDFADTAFALKVGQISKPIKTPIGYHIIKVLGKKPAGMQTLADVKKQIHQKLAEQKASEYIQDVSEQIQASIMKGTQIHDAGKEQKLFPMLTGLIPISIAAKQLDLKTKEDITKLLDVKPNTTIEIPLITNTGYAFVRIKEIKQEGHKPLEAVENEISITLSNKKAQKLAQEDAERVLASLQNQGNSSTKLKLSQSPEFLRKGSIENLDNPQIVNDVFSAQPGTWLSTPYLIKQGAVIAYVSKKITSPMPQVWEKEKEQFMASLLKAKKEEVFRGFLSTLEKNATIKIGYDAIKASLN